MSYATGEAAILTLIRALSAYNANNSKRQDWKPLHSGSAAYYAILRPGPWESEQMGITSTYHDRYTTVVEVWRRYVDDTKPTTLQTDVGTIVAQLRKYPTLNGNVGRSWVAGGDDMQEVTLNNGSLWARWNINVEWIEESSVTYAE
jgi:hypothetical protein